MTTNEIIVADLTIREGMQYFGMMLSLDERIRILEFQEMLGVDMSQTAYPPAHITEREALKYLHQFAQSSQLQIKVSGLCRALSEDIEPLLPLDLSVYSLHTAITKEMLLHRDAGKIFDDVKESVAHIRSASPEALIEVNLIDIGKTEAALLQQMIAYLVDPLGVDIIIVPDTSGLMAPNKMFDTVKRIVAANTEATGTRIGVHCHNDMGMASANTVMGAVAGARVVQLSALGIGERNGIGDLFTVGKCLKEQGFRLRLKTEELELFARYYEYIDELSREKLNISLLTPNTPFFGRAVSSHVAGTHGMGEFGVAREAHYHLNVLCGRHLVKRYLEDHNIPFEGEDLQALVGKIKNKSVQEGRALSKAEVMDIVLDI